MSWIDRAEYCLEQAPPGTLKLYWEQTARTFGSPAERIAILEYLRQRVKSDSSIDVDRLVSTLFQQCRVPEIHHSDEPIDRKMSWEQVTKLTVDDLFTVGGHSHRHVTLSFLTAAQLEREVGTSIDLLHRKVGLRLRHYSYPEGLDYCYSDTVIRKLQTKGIVCCPTAVDGINDHHSDLFRLRRIMVT